VHRPRSRRAASLAGDTTHRAVVLLAALVLALGGICAGAGVLVREHGRITELVAAATDVREAHEARLDQERAFRRFLENGDSLHLDRFATATRDLDGATRRAVARVQGDRTLVDRVVAVELAWAAWLGDAEALMIDGTVPAGRERSVALARSDAHLELYAAAEDRLREALTTARNEHIDHQRLLLWIVFSAQVALIGLVVIAVLRHRRTVERDVVAPVADLRDVLGRLERGDLRARADAFRYEELAAVGASVASLAEALADERRQAALGADRLRALVGVGRQLSGTLDLLSVRDAATAAATEVSGWSAAVHLVGDATLEGEPADVAATGRSTFADDRCLLPMAVDGRIVGVLACARGAGAAPLDLDARETLALLASQAATAVAAATVHERVREESRVDPLTRLANRRSFADDAEHELARADRYDRALSLVLLDLDHFKGVNDVHGHQVGDAVLEGVAAVLAANLRPTDTAYRYGGEEIVVLLPETDLDDAAAVAERLRTAVAGRRVAGCRVTASFGVVEHRRAETVDDLVGRADVALYEAKVGGRDRVVVSGRSPARRSFLGTS
jgi:diguanylate cyclase (GGDEF)-like protein